MLVVLAVVIVGAALLSLAVLTAAGEARRTTRWPLVALAGPFFPLTWVVWYVRDEPLGARGVRAGRR